METYAGNMDARGAVVRDKKFLESLQEVLKLNWLKSKTEEEKSALVEKALTSFASAAVENNDYFSLHVLLEQMDVNSRSYDGTTILHTACEVGNLDMVKFLLDKGASPQFVNGTEKCPLHLAIKNRQFNVIKLLHSKGFTVRLHPVRIAMEMIQAVQKRDYPLLQAWFLSGVDMDTKDYNGWTVMDEAVRLGDNTMISKILEFEGIRNNN